MTLRPAAMLAALALAACAKKPVIDRSFAQGDRLDVLPDVSEVPVEGFRVTVDARARTVSGELLAVDPTSVWVLEDVDGEHARPVAVPRRDIRRVGVVARDAGGEATNTWAIVGMLSTLSHGVFLIFSAPVWAGAGIATGLDEGLSNDLQVERSSLDALPQYSRFPQGMPPRYLQSFARAR